MSPLTANAADTQQLFGWLAATALAAVLFRLVRRAERRSIRIAFVLVAIGLMANAATLVPLEPVLRTAAHDAAVVLAGLAVIQVACAWLFRALLPVLRLVVPRIAHDLAVTALSFAWALVALRLAGVDASSLFTTSAVLTAVLAFSMQDTLGNVLGGVALQLDNSLRVGDWVRIDDVSGRVVDVRWRYTAVETRARELVIVPNSWLMKNRFQVVRPPAEGPLAWRRSIVLQVDADAPPERVIAALEAAVADASIEHVLKSPAPSAVLADVGPGASRYVLRYWLAEPQLDDPTDSAVRVHALAALERAGVRLGVPQQEHLTIQEDASWRAAAAQQERERRLHALRSTELFAHLPAQEQEALAGHLVHAPFAAGDAMTRQGAVAHWLYLIVQGDAQVLLEGVHGRLPVARLGPGDVFGEMGMLTGEPRGATVVAATAVDCYRLDKAGFAQVLQARPELASEIAAIVQRRHAELDARRAQAGSSEPAHEDLVSRIRRFFSLHGADPTAAQELAGAGFTRERQEVPQG